MAAIATRLRAPVWMQDAVLAALVTLFQIRGTLLVARGPDPAAALAEPAYLGYVLLIGSGLALLARRRWPVAVFAAVAGVSLVYYTAGYPDGPGWVGLFVALYTVTAQGDGRRSLTIVAAGLSVLTVGWLLTADLAPLAAAGWVFFRIGTAIMAAALGESVRTRRVIVSEAQQRAERAEHTREQEARQRVDAERLRIAREVHDTVAHAIAVINVQAGVTAHVLDKRPEQARETLITIEQTSARALQELRATLGMLRDVDDDGRAPAPGLGRIGELTGIAREAGLDVIVDIGSPARELPSAVDHAAYRIVQESITNVIRHAGPSRVTISLRYGSGDLEIRIADDGRGPCLPADGSGGGRGIAGMRERAVLLGGDLETGPLPGGGFEVAARLPLQSDAAVPQ
ncbi:MAG: sensor histidine kinase [Pseudonocardiaceae bacterium]|nr:sensor histidine kinase [Pseudonocardiaceae bacterium]